MFKSIIYTRVSGNRQTPQSALSMQKSICARRDLPAYYRNYVQGALDERWLQDYIDMQHNREDSTFNNTTAWSPAMRILIMLAGAFVALWGMSNYADYINSAFHCCADCPGLWADGGVVTRATLPQMGHPAITLVVVGVVLLLFVLFLIFATAQFAQTLPAYQSQAHATAQQVQAWLVSMGYDPAGSTAVAGQTDTSWALDLTKDFLGALVNALGNASTMALLMVFLFVNVILFPGRLAWQGLHGSSYAKRVGAFTRGAAPVYRCHGDHRHHHRHTQYDMVLYYWVYRNRSSGVCFPAFSTSFRLLVSGSG